MEKIVSYKGFTIEFRSKKDGKTSFKISSDKIYGRPCGCYWCNGLWWESYEKAYQAAQQTIDAGNIVKDNAIDIRKERV